MKLAIDARSLVTRPTGVGHFLLAAVNVWAEQRPDIEFLLLAHKPLHPDAELALRKLENIRFHVCPTPRWPGNGLWWMLTGFAAGARERGATHLWGASGVLPLHGTRDLVTLLTVHDLVYLSMPRTMALRTRIAYGLMAGHAIRHADCLWSVSNFTAGEIQRYYPHRRASTIIVGSGLNPWRAQRTIDDHHVTEVAARYRVDAHTLLFVGTLEPRKNLAFLLGLMPRLAVSGWRLVVVGCAGWGRSDLAALVEAPAFPRSAVVFCDYVPDADLQALYRCVAFFISTALMEGFGLPHLEAMAAGCPVIAPANSAVVEVVGQAGQLVEGWTPDAWVAAIEQAFQRRDLLQASAAAQVARHDIGDACRSVTLALTDQQT